MLHTLIFPGSTCWSPNTCALLAAASTVDQGFHMRHRICWVNDFLYGENGLRNHHMWWCSPIIFGQSYVSYVWSGPRAPIQALGTFLYTLYGKRSTSVTSWGSFEPLFNVNIGWATKLYYRYNMNQYDIVRILLKLRTCTITPNPFKSPFTRALLLQIAVARKQKRGWPRGYPVLGHGHGCLAEGNGLDWVQLGWSFHLGKGSHVSGVL